MRKTEALRLLDDIKRDLDERDMSKSIYLSIRHIGTKVFKNAACQILDGWFFVITPSESFCIKESDMGDFICIDSTEMPIYSFKNHE